MKTDELKVIIKAAEALGHSNIDLVLIDGGDESYPLAVAQIIKTGDQREEYVAIGFKHSTS